MVIEKTSTRSKSVYISQLIMCESVGGRMQEIYYFLTARPKIENTTRSDYDTRKFTLFFTTSFKNNCKDFAIKRAQAYIPGKSRSCNLCTEKKLQITKSKSESLLNKRSELFSRCCHRNRFSVWNFKRKKTRQQAKSVSNEPVRTLVADKRLIIALA